MWACAIVVGIVGAVAYVWGRSDRTEHHLTGCQCRMCREVDKAKLMTAAGYRPCYSCAGRGWLYHGTPPTKPERTEP